MRRAVTDVVFMRTVTQDAIFAAIPESELGASARASDDAGSDKLRAVSASGARSATKATGTHGARVTSHGDAGTNDDFAANVNAHGMANATHAGTTQTTNARGGGKASTKKGAEDADAGTRPALPKPDYLTACPRCKSDDTKFCYYNNYNVKQPRFYCKGCCRYWTEGGTLRNVRVGAGRRKAKSAVAVKDATTAVVADMATGDGSHMPSTVKKAGVKRSRATAAKTTEATKTKTTTEVARGGDAGVRRSKAPTRARIKRDGSSDGSATEAEQGPGSYGHKWQNGSNDASNTAARGASPEDQGSAEGSQPGCDGSNAKTFVGNTATGRYSDGTWAVDPAAYSRMMSSGQAGQAQAAAAAAASAAIMSAATGWGMQFWNKSPAFPFGTPSSNLGLNSAHQMTFPTSTPISEAALKCDGLSHPTPLHPAAAAAAAYSHASRGVHVPQYSSMFQNPWAQFIPHDSKGFHSNPAAFQAMQQHMMNQQLAQFMHMQQFGGMSSGYGGTTTATVTTEPEPTKQQSSENVADELNKSVSAAQ